MGTKNSFKHSTSCPENRDEVIYWYLNGKLSEAEMLVFEQHYFHCTDCMEAVRFIQELREVASEEASALKPVYSPQQSTSEAEVISLPDIKTLAFETGWKKRRSWLTAAAAVILLLVTFKLSFLTENNGHITTNLPDKAEIAEWVAKYGSAFYQLDYLETQISSRLRSSTKPLKSVVPPDNTIMQDSLVFQWEAAPNATGTYQTLFLSILDNQAKEIFVQELAHASFSYKEKLHPGIYYWTLETKRETLHIGKFFVLPKESK